MKQGDVTDSRSKISQKVAFNENNEFNNVLLKCSVCLNYIKISKISSVSQARKSSPKALFYLLRNIPQYLHKTAENTAMFCANYLERLLP